MAIRERIRTKTGSWRFRFAAPGLLLSCGLAITLALASTTTAGAEEPGSGLTLVLRSTGEREQRTATHYFTSKGARFDQGEMEIVVKFDTLRVFHIFHRKKVFYETTIEGMERAMTWTSTEMARAMAGIPPELRAKMMGDASGEATITRGGERTIAGEACREIVVALGEKTHIDLCVSADLAPPFDPKYFAALAVATAPVGRGNSGISKLVARLREIEGFALASAISLRLFGRKMDSSFEAVEIKHGPVGRDIFELPEGYQEVDSPFARAGR